MKRIVFKAFVLAAAISIAARPGPSVAQQVVFDPTAAVNFAKGLVEVKNQLETARSQLSQAQQMYESVTGTRGFGDVLRDGNLEQYLPADARALYDGSGGGAGITSSIQDILRQEQDGLTGAVPDAEARSRQRVQTALATNKVLGLRAYEGAGARLEQIEALLDQIGQTQDPQALGELQARLAGEQAAIHNEAVKLQVIASLRDMEDRLAAQQRDELSRRILDPTLQEMPGIEPSSAGQ